MAKRKTQLSDDEVEDTVQETFIEVFKNISKLKDLDKFQNWTLSNKYKKYTKKHNKDINLLKNLENESNLLWKLGNRGK